MPHARYIKIWKPKKWKKMWLLKLPRFLSTTERHIPPPIWKRLTPWSLAGACSSRGIVRNRGGQSTGSKATVATFTPKQHVPMEIDNFQAKTTNITKARMSFQNKSINIASLQSVSAQLVVSTNYCVFQPCTFNATKSCTNWNKAYILHLELTVTIFDNVICHWI